METMNIKRLGRIENILQFWFGDRVEESESYVENRMGFWFSKSPSLDKEIKDRFELQDYKLSIEGKTTPWRETALGCLALVLVFDQFPRNMFRGNKLMFATDGRALEIAKYAIASGYDKKLVPIQRIFIYMPFQHSENLENQTLSLKLFKELLKESPSLGSDNRYAEKHFEIIKRFGRFPHRNEILGRKSTPEEIEFLKQPGSSF